MKHIILFLSLLFLPVVLLAQTGSSLIPTYHWSYNYMEELRVRGYLQELNFSHRPFYVDDVIHGLSSLSQSEDIMLDNTSKLLLQHLQQNYMPKNEMAKSAGIIYAQLFFDNNLAKLSSRPTSRSPLIAGKIQKDDWIDYFRPRGRIGFQFMKNLAIQNTFLTDNHLDEDPNYLGKHQSGLASFSEESYITYRLKSFNFLLGRSFLRWGAGQTGTLLISDTARPLDQFYADFHYKWLRFSFITASLNTLTDSVQANRYLSAQRLDLHLRHNLRFGISEAVLYGGAGISPQFAFHNPVMFFHGVIVNGPTNANSLGSIDVSYYPIQDVHLYGELMIDDIQLEKSGAGDLEPNEWGMILGAQWAQSRLFLQSEYVRITNRTYKTPQFWERFTHRHDPIGYYLGNDFDQIWLHGNYWILPTVRLQSQFQYIRRGEGRIDTPFDTPWMDTPVGQDYTEPFPTGIVEKTLRYELGARWHPVKSFGYAELLVGHERVENLGNQAGKDADGWYARLGFWLEIGKYWFMNGE